MTDLSVPQALPTFPEAATAGDTGHDATWSTVLQRVLHEPRRVRVHYQPIVDLQRGVVRGYEALARFPEAPDVPTLAWFEAAARLGCAGALEAQVMSAALLARPLLLRNRFIAVNLSPTALLSDEVAAVLRAEDRLDAIVLELTDHGVPAEDLQLRRAIDALRERGAALAVDGHGSGSVAVAWHEALRPRFIKLDSTRALDRAGSAAVEELLRLAERLDAAIVAQGIEDEAQLDGLARLGIALGQGYAIARPAPAMVELDRALAGRMRERSLAGERHRGVERLVEPAPAVAGGATSIRLAFGAQPHLEHVVVADAHGRPTGIVDRVSFDRGASPREPLRLPASTPAQDLARAAVGRPLDRRWDPVVVVDEHGRYLGIVPLDRVVRVLTGG